MNCINAKTKGIHLASVTRFLLNCLLIVFNVAELSQALDELYTVRLPLENEVNDNSQI